MVLHYLKNLMRYSTSLVVLFLMLTVRTSTLLASDFNLNEASFGLPHIYGDKENTEYLYVTSGEKLYCIGNQAGEFPKVGFHTPGQMGGIWMHPIKLLDGFGLQISDSETKKNLTVVCDSFVTYPFLSKFIYHSPSFPATITRTQFVPDGKPVLVIEYSIVNHSSQSRSYELDFSASVNLMPVWLSERIGLNDSRDTLINNDIHRSIIYFRDKQNQWFAGVGFDSERVRFEKTTPTTYSDNGVNAVSHLTCTVAAGKSFTFHVYISGSLTDTKEIAENIAYVKNHLPTLFSEKKNRYDTITRTAQISIPDKPLEKAYLWGKFATDWLRRDVPGLGKGLSAGLPDYPWFFSNDQATTFMAITGTVQPRLFYNAYDMLKRISNRETNSNGSIVHEISSNGVVYAKDRMEESQLHIMAAWEIFKWTGNIDFLKENYEFGKKTWLWLQKHDTNRNGYIEGNGGAEIEGLDDEMLDVQINTARFLDIMSRMALLFHDKEDAGIYRQKADELKEKINSEWWIGSENRYADFIAPKDKALKIIEDALTKRVVAGRNDWAKAKLENLKQQVLNNDYPYKGYVVYYNPSGLLPMETGLADPERSGKMLKHAGFFTNKFGEYITGIERPDNVSIDEKRFQKDTAFTYNRAVMPAATSGLAEAAARLGMPDTALTYIHKTVNSFSYATPGTVYEVSPDYGMFVQAWNVTSINIPLIKYFFGVDPNAYGKEITMSPQMPSDWHYATLNELLVGNNKLSVHYAKTGKRISFKISSTESGWKIHFMLNDKAENILLNNSSIPSNKRKIELTGLKNTISLDLN